MSVDDVTGGIISKGKSAVDTLSSIFGAIEKITIAATGLYLLFQKFPALGSAAKIAFGGMLKSMQTSFPLVSKAVGVVLAQFKKLASTDIGKRVAIALAAPLIAKAFLLIAGGAIIAAGAFAKLFLSRSKAAGETKDLADTLEETTRAFQALRLAAQATGADMDSIATAMGHAAKAQSEAVTGSEEMRDAFTRLGLSLDQVRKMSQTDIFNKISRDMKDGKINVANYSAVLSVLGKDARSLFPAMKKGISEISDEFAKGGPIISQNILDQLDEADAKLQKFWTTGKGWVAWAASGIASGGVGIAKRAHALLELAGSIAERPMSGQDIAKAWDAYGERSAKSDLVGDDEYGKSKIISGEMQKELERRQGIKAAEAAELKTLREKNAEKENEVRIAGLTAEKRKEALQAERESLRTQIEGTKDAVEREKLRAKMLDVDKDLAGKKTPNNTVTKRDVDQYSRVGIVRGGSNASIGIMQKQLQVQSQQLSVQQRQLAQFVKMLTELKSTNNNLTSEYE